MTQHHTPWVRFVVDTRAYEAGLARLAEAIHTNTYWTKAGAETEVYHLRLQSLYTGEELEKALALFDGKRIELAKYTPLSHSEACEQAYRWTVKEMEAAK